MKKLFLILLLQAISIVGPTTVPQYKFVELKIESKEKVQDAEWDVIYVNDPKISVSTKEVTSNGDTLLFVGPPGSYRATAWAQVEGKLTHSSITVSIESNSIPAPVSEHHIPDPISPVPPPILPPGPAANSGLKVLILYDFNKLSSMPRSQLIILYNVELRKYLSEVAVFRIWEQNIQITTDSIIWKELLSRPHPTMPWIVITNGKEEFDGPLPTNTEETIALIRKYEIKR